MGDIRYIKLDICYLYNYSLQEHVAAETMHMYIPENIMFLFITWLHTCQKIYKLAHKLLENVIMQFISNTWYGHTLETISAKYILYLYQQLVAIVWQIITLKLTHKSIESRCITGF